MQLQNCLFIEKKIAKHIHIKRRLGTQVLYIIDILYKISMLYIHSYYTSTQIAWTDIQVEKRIR
jgi:hypothetical protein